MAGQEVQGMLIRLEATTAQLRQEMARADSSVAQVSGRIDRQLSQVDSAFDRVGLSAQRMGGILKGALAIGIGGSGIGALISQAEAYTQIANRLKLVTSNSAEFTAAQNSVFSIAQKAGQPLGATAELYQRIAQNQDALKLSGKGVAGIVETISKTMVISGASAASSSAALVQLGQAFASGTLRGEELNSIMEQAPALSQAIAKGMGVSVGALRALGAEGKLTAESVVQALQAQQGAVDALFGKMQDTIGTGLTRVQTSFTKMIGEGDKVGGMSSRISAALTSASKAMDAVTADGEGFTETVKNLGNALENVAYVGAAALTLGAGKMAVSFAQATLASVKQAGALVLSTKASLEALTAEAALAKQSLLTAQTRQLEAKALVERTGLELAAAESKVASDRIRQASELGNLKFVQSTLTAERELEAQRLKAQITDQGRALSIARIAELRTAEAGAIKLVQAAEVSLAATTVATSAEITAALGAQTVARGVLAETTATTNAAKVASDRAAAAAAVGARASMALTTAGGGLLALLSGPVGLIAMTGLIAASFIDFGDSADTATAALIDQNSTIDESIKKYNELGEAQRRYQAITWAEEQIKATESATLALNKYSADGAEAFLQIGHDANEYRAKFKEMIEEVRKGQRTLDSVTEWAKKDAGLTEDKIKKLSESSSAYEETSKKAGDLGKILGVVSGATASVTSSTEKLKVAQKDSGQTDASKAAWDKYVEQLTKTRDLLGANAAAEAAYTAAKMGATPAQAAQAKLIADQTDTLKKYQDAIKEGDRVQQASLKLQLVALYTAEDAANQAAAAQKTALDETAKASEESATRQVNAMQRIIDQTMRVVTGQNMLLVTPPKQNLTGYGLLTNGGTAPAVPATPKATPLDRATAAIAQLDATTEANKRVDKAANAAATAIKNQEKALTDLLAKSGISTKASNDIADAYLAGAINVRELTIRQEIEQEVLKTGAKSYDQVKDAINALHDAKDREDVMKNVAELKVEVDQIIKQATATLQGKDALEAYNVEKAMTVALSGKKIAIDSEEYKQLLATTKAQLDANKAMESAGRIEGIIDRLNPEIKLLKDYEQAQQDIYAAMELAPGKTALYQDALVKLGNEYEVNRSKATIWGQMTEGAIDRIDEAFASAWGNIGSGAESLWDNLKKGFKQTLGEIAHMLTTKPLLASISNWLTGTDNGQGLGSVWSKLLGSAGGSGGGGGLSSMFGGGSDSNGWGGMVSLGKNLYSAWSNLTGVGSSIASGYASGGIGGALSGGASYYTTMLSNLYTTVTGYVSSAVASITGSAATTAATQAAASAAASSAGSTATSGGAMWGPIAIIMGSIFSSKLYKEGVRPDASALNDAAGGTALGTAVLGPSIAMAKFYESADKFLGGIVGGKLASMLTGSIINQAVWGKVGSKLFGSGYKTKDVGIELGVDGGVFDAQQYVKQKKKGGLISGSSKTRYLHNPLDAETQDALGAAFNDKILNSMGLFSALGVKLSDSVLDGLNMAATRISTQGKTSEAIQEELDKWFSGLGDSAVSAINAATNSGLENYNFEALTTFVNNLYSVNDSFDMLGLKLYDVSVSTGFMAEQLISMAGGLEALKAGESSFFENFYTDTEKADYALSTVNKQFEAMGVKLPGTRDAYRDMVEALDRTTESGRQMYVTLTGMSGSAAQAFDILESRTNALNESMMGAVTNAQSAVQRAISAQQKKATEAYNATNTSLNDMVSTVTENVSGLNSVSSSLSTALKALRGDSDDAMKMLRAQAQATLQSALVTARSGKSLSGFTGLEDALDTVSNNNTDLYGSMEDFARDQGRTANVVAELNAINGKQLTSAEASLAGLKTQIDLAKAAYDAQMAQFDSQLEFAQAQMDALNGVDNSVMGVTAAVNAMNLAVVAALAGITGKASDGTSTNNGTLIDSVYQSLLGREADAAGKDYWQGQLASGAITYDQLAQAIANAAKEKGQAIKVPGYASGGDFGGGLRLVGENGPELEVTGPSRIFNANQTASMLRGGGDSGATAEEVRALRRDIESNATYMAKLTKAVADGIDTLVNSGVQINGTVETKAVA